MVMPVKRFLTVMVVFLILGLTASSAMAASDVVPKSTPNVPTTLKCPCCSGNVSLPKDLRVQELRGPTTYLMALRAFNTKDSIMLREHLRDQNLVPVYEKATVLIVEYNGTTTEIVKVPLVGSTSVGQLVYVQNKYGSALALGRYVLGSHEIEVYTVDINGNIHKEIRPLGFWGSLKCFICEYVADAVIKLGGTVACTGVCGTVCLMSTPIPGAVATCLATCFPICSVVSGIVVEYLKYNKYISPHEVCKKAGYC
ncbi:hypothetical protein [Thermococcus thermotolerans]|uniref:hypothetical protein n=1 Tax=Thermococcus thermotolerans TaxID=2969672 RepID=UPI002158693C|nr:hypothetical protein [Thermococcus thermotolerans]